MCRTICSASCATASRWAPRSRAAGAAYHGRRPAGRALSGDPRVTPPRQSCAGHDPGVSVVRSLCRPRPLSASGQRLRGHRTLVTILADMAEANGSLPGTGRFPIAHLITPAERAGAQRLTPGVLLRTGEGWWPFHASCGKLRHVSYKVGPAISRAICRVVPVAGTQPSSMVLDVTWTMPPCAGGGTSPRRFARRSGAPSLGALRKRRPAGVREVHVPGHQLPYCPCGRSGLGQHHRGSRVAAHLQGLATAHVA